MNENITIEMVDEVLKRVNVSIEDAAEALELNNCDVLSAIIYLEKNKKVRTSSKEKFEKNIDNTCNSLTSWLKKIIHLGNTNYIVIRKDEKIISNLSITITSITLIFGFYVVIPLLILAMLTGHQITFEGSELEKTQANKYSKKIQEEINEIKEKL
jgi:hypothetical protein